MIRKVIKIGNSDGVTIPASVMRAKKLEAGDKIEVYIGEPGGELAHLELLKQLDKFNKQYAKALKKTRKKLS